MVNRAKELEGVLRRGTGGSSGSGGGLGVYAVGVEVLWYLPKEFADAYEELWIRAHGTEVRGKGEEGRNERVRSRRVAGRVKSDGVDTMAPAKAAGKVLAGGGVGVGDEKALATKQRVDRKLRRIARDITRKEGVGGENKRRCVKCRKWAEPEWVFCPYDGNATEEQ